MNLIEYLTGYRRVRPVSRITFELIAEEWLQAIEREDLPKMHYWLGYSERQRQRRPFTPIRIWLKIK